MKKKNTIHLFFIILLVCIASILCYQNYTPNTILSGWDTIHPEFNIREYFTRIISVWQTHQGLGAPPSQAHASELPRMILYALFMVVFPSSFVRYAYIFLTIILGPIGVYLFIQYLLSKQDKHLLITCLASFIGALFYLLNNTTLQHYIVVLEMFATKFAFLGFIFYFATKYLDHKRKTDLLFFVLSLFFASSMAHTATLWYVFFAGFAVYVVLYALLHRKTHPTIIKQAGLLIITTLLLNLYWILPNIYYSRNYSYQMIQSKINRLGSEELYQQNKYFGDLGNFALMKNFLFNWFVSVPTYANEGLKTTSTPLMGVWSRYLDKPIVFLSYILFDLLCMLGILQSLLRKDKSFMSLAPFTLLSAFFLLTNVPIISHIFELLRQNTLFREAFRFPFTKLSIYYVFGFSLFISYAIHWIFQKSNIHTNVYKPLAITGMLAALIIILSFPAFEGNFISPIIRVKIPQEYDALFSWSKTQSPQGRILILPFQSLYGWVNYLFEDNQTDYVYQGAGFTWFGLLQPSLNREFDRWNSLNEEAYREFFYALYSNNARLFQSLLYKYNITYILIDKNTVLPGDTAQDKKLFYPQTETLLSRIEEVTQTNRFSTSLFLYSVRQQVDSSPFYILHNAPHIWPPYEMNYIDQAYLDYGDYITPLQKTPESVIYPGRQLFNRTERLNKEMFSADDSKYNILIPKKQEGTKIEYPLIQETEKEIYADILFSTEKDSPQIAFSYFLPSEDSQSDNTQNFSIKPGEDKYIAINNELFPIPDQMNNQTVLGQAMIPTDTQSIIEYYDFSKGKPLQLALPEAIPALCSPTQENQVFGVDQRKDSLQMYGQNAQICSDINLDSLVYTLPQNGLLELQFTTQSDAELSACMFDSTQNSCVNKKDLSYNTRHSYLIPLSKSSPGTLLRFILNAKTSNSMKTSLIDRIKISFIPVKKTVYFTPTRLTADDSSYIELIGSYPENQFVYDVGKIGTEKNDCSQTSARFIEKKVNETYATYTVQDGAICQTFSFQGASTNIGQLLAITSRFEEGMPMRICIEQNETKKCLIDDELSKYSDFQTDYFMIPPFYNNDPYFLTVKNISIGDTISKSHIESIKMIPFPYNYIQSIKELPNPDIKRIQTGTRITIPSEDYSFISDYRYQVNTLIEKNSVLATDVAYDNGWAAYEIDPSSILQTYIPFVFGTKLTSHVLVNNWANGWEIPRNINAAVIIYLPQYLLWIGLVIFVITIFVHLRSEI